MRTRNRRSLRVLAADDSAVMRMVLRALFQRHEDDTNSALQRMELLDVVVDGAECLDAVARLKPDLLLLDLEMPRIDGLGVLAGLRTAAPSLPVILCSAHSEPGARATLDGLALGARDYVMKPTGQTGLESTLDLLANQLLPKIATFAGEARHLYRSGPEAGQASPRCSAHMVLPVAAVLPSRAVTPQVNLVVIGVSTGGPSALETILPMLPATLPVPVLIVQHMPKLFTGALAERLNHICALPVTEAYDGAAVRPGHIWLAPGDAHMELACVLGARDANTPVVRLHQSKPLNSCMPSADYLFQSAARLYGPSVLAVVMTGMGCDGLDGAQLIHDAGGSVIVQDEATSAVWGMPGRIVEAGIASAVLPLAHISREINSRVNAGRAAYPRNTPAPSTGRRETLYGLL